MKTSGKLKKIIIDEIERNNFLSWNLNTLDEIKH
jgi:hypothetical protein